MVMKQHPLTTQSLTQRSNLLPGPVLGAQSVERQEEWLGPRIASVNANSHTELNIRFRNLEIIEDLEVQIWWWSRSKALIHVDTTKKE